MDHSLSSVLNASNRVFNLFLDICSLVDDGFIPSDLYIKKELIVIGERINNISVPNSDEIIKELHTISSDLELIRDSYIKFGI